MKRTAGALALLAALGGGVALGGPYMSQVWNPPQPDGVHWGVREVPTVPGLMGPWGQAIPMAAPYNASPPSGETLARQMLAQSMPLEMMQLAGYSKDIQLAQGPACGPGGCPMPPGVGGPGNLISPPGVPPVPPGLPPGLRPPGAVAAVGALTGPAVSPFAVQRSEVRFVGPAGMRISWFAPGPDGKPGFGPQYLEAPGRYNFLQAAIYRLKISDIPHHPGLVLYPTLEVVPAKAKTATFLSHSAVPVSFTEEDFEQVAAGNFVVKVIYLPDPAFQDLAATGPDEVVSSRLEPGVDPIIEAQRRGCILLVVRLGNIDLEVPNTPAMDAPNPFCPPGAAAAAPPGPAQMAPGLPMPAPQAPYGMNMPGPGMPGLPGMPMPPMPGMGLPPTMGQPPMTPGGRGPVQGMPAVLPPPGLPVPPTPPTGPVGQAPAATRPTLAQLAGQLPPSAAVTPASGQPQR
jgi:hypothetical protein